MFNIFFNCVIQCFPTALFNIKYILLFILAFSTNMKAIILCIKSLFYKLLFCSYCISFLYTSIMQLLCLISVHFSYVAVFSFLHTSILQLTLICLLHFRHQYGSRTTEWPCVSSALRNSPLRSADITAVRVVRWALLMNLQLYFFTAYFSLISRKSVA